jgi:hypothetical protein
VPAPFPGTRITRLSPFARADIATTCRIGCPGCNEQSTKLFAWNRKNFCVLPRTDASGRGVFALAANGSQTGEGNNQGEVQQVPAKRQNRGPGNSTGDGFNRQKTRQRRKLDEYTKCQPQNRRSGIFQEDGEKIARIIDRGHENAAMSQEAHAHYGDKFTRTDAYVYFIRGVLTAIFQKPE